MYRSLKLTYEVFVGECVHNDLRSAQLMVFVIMTYASAIATDHTILGNGGILCKLFR